MIDEYAIELSEEDETFFEEFTGKFNEAYIQTAEERVNINDQITSSTESNITIIVAQDTCENVIIPSGKDVTLKIEEGVTLTNVEKAHTITVQDGGTLTIVSEGTIDNITHGYAALKVEEGGTATIESGTFTRSKEAGKSATNSGGNSFYYIQNHGVLTIEDAYVVSDGHFSSLIQNGFYDCSTENPNNYQPELTIEGGTFSGGINTIKNDDDGILKITGGNFSNTTQYALMNCNVATIEGGTFSVAEGSTYDAVWNRYAGSKEHDAGQMIITGGTFKDSIWSNANSTLTVEGIDAIKKFYITKGAKFSITDNAKLEKVSDEDSSYTFLGWFNKNGKTPNNPGDLENGVSVYEYKPVYLETKIDSTVDDVDVTDRKDNTINSSVQELITKGTGSGESDVKVESVVVGQELDDILKAAVINDDLITTKVEITDVKETDIAEDVKKKIDTAVAELPKSDTADSTDTTAENSWKVVSDSFVNIDINMYVSQGEGNGEKKIARLTQINNEMDFSIAIPESLRNKNNEYKVVRYHGDTAEILNPESSDETKVVFKSDLFSYYALVYKEKVADNTDSKKDDSSTDNTDGKKDDSNTDNTSDKKDDSNTNNTNNNSDNTNNTSKNNSGSSSESRDRDKEISKITGQWRMNDKGWQYRLSNGTYPKDSWYECAWNGVTSWYHFNAEGYADGGWFTDKDGQRYYLHNVHDGTFGAMYTGWKQIVDQWYYFNSEKSADGASKGSLVMNGVTPDGYSVDTNGAWIH